MSGSNVYQIDLSVNAIYIVQDGHCTMLPAMEFGSDTFIIRNNKILDVIRSKRVRLNGQDKIE
ncbi:hypothetical protein [Psychrobacillus sp. L3]|uniref:hypothetical protein n=1 Tax=Psychrobacillus sp. L3 TaxID=3236891 RepID=UPI0036F22492